MGQRSILIKGGLLSGLVFILSWVVFHWLYVAGKDQPEFGSGESLGYLTMLIALSTVYFSVRSYRDSQLGGHISFKEAFLNGMLVVMVASLFYVLSWMVYYPNFIPDFMEEYSKMELDALRAAGISGDELAMKQKEMAEFKVSYENPFFMAGVTFLEIFPVGLLVALFSALLLKRRP